MGGDILGKEAEAASSLAQGAFGALQVTEHLGWCSKCLCMKFVRNRKFETPAIKIVGLGTVGNTSMHFIVLLSCRLAPGEV